MPCDSLGECDISWNWLSTICICKTTTKGKDERERERVKNSTLVDRTHHLQNLKMENMLRTWWCYWSVFFFLWVNWKFLFSSDSVYKLELRSFCDSWVNLPRVFPIKTKMKVPPKDAVLNEYTALVKWRPIIHRRTATPFGFHVVAIRDDGSARNPQLNPNVICSGF